MKNPCYLLPLLCAAVLAVGMLLTGCSHSASDKFDNLSRAQQMNALQTGSPEKLTPEQERDLQSKIRAATARMAAQHGAHGPQMGGSR